MSGILFFSYGVPCLGLFWCCIRYFFDAVRWPAAARNAHQFPHVDVIPSISLSRRPRFSFLVFSLKGNRWAHCDQTKPFKNKTTEKTTRQKRMREISSPSAAISSSLSKFWLYRNADMERKKQNKKTRTSKSSKSDDCPDVTNFRWVFLSFSCAPFENATCCVTTRTDDDESLDDKSLVLCCVLTSRDEHSNDLEHTTAHQVIIIFHHHLVRSHDKFISPFSRERKI